MKNLILNFRKYLKAYLITFFVSLAIGVVIFSLFFFINSQTLIAATDGASVAFIVLISCGALAFVARQGMFDSFTYGFGQMFSSMFAKKANKMNDYHSYLDEKKAKREATPSLFLAIILAALIFGIIALVLFIIYKVKFG